MTTINLLSELKRRRREIAAAEKGEPIGGSGGSGLSAFIEKLRSSSGGGESSLKLEAPQKLGLALLLVGAGTFTQHEMIVRHMYINDMQAAAEAEREVARSEMAEWEEKLRAFDSIKAEIQSFDAQMNELRQKLAVIETMQKGRSSIVRMIDFMVREMPEEIWLSEVSVDVSTEARRNGSMGKVDMSGNSMSLQQLSRFIETLERGVFFKKWNLQETATQPGVQGTPGLGSYTTKTFKIDAEVQSL